MEAEFCLSIKKKWKTFYASFYYKKPQNTCFSDLYNLKERGNKLPIRSAL